MFGHSYVKFLSTPSLSLLFHISSLRCSSSNSLRSSVVLSAHATLLIFRWPPGIQNLPTGYLKIQLYWCFSNVPCVVSINFPFIIFWLLQAQTRCWTPRIHLGWRTQLSENIHAPLLCNLDRLQLCTLWTPATYLILLSFCLESTNPKDGSLHAGN